MHKEDFIRDIAKFESISCIHEQREAVKEYLLKKYSFSEKTTFKTNKEAAEKVDFILKNYSSYENLHNQDIYFKDVIGTSSYKKHSVLTRVVTGSKRMHGLYDKLVDNPEYFFGAINNENYNTISYIGVEDENGNYKYIANQGFHRTALGMYLESVIYDADVKINNVILTKYKINEDRLKLIAEAEKIFNKYGYKIEFSYNTFSKESHTYRIIETIKIYRRENSIFVDNYFKELNYEYAKNDIEEEIKRNDLLLKSDLKEIINNIPMSIKLLHSVKLIKESYKMIKDIRLDKI